MIPFGNGLRQLLLEEALCTPLLGHMGACKVISTLQPRVWWPRLTLDVHTFICRHFVCQQAKDSTQQPLEQLQLLPILSERFSVWSMDFATGFLEDSSYNTIFVCVDKLTKLVRLTPCSTGGGENYRWKKQHGYFW